VEVATPIRDQAIQDLGPAISTDDVLDVRLALKDYQGDLKSLLSGVAP